MTPSLAVFIHLTLRLRIVSTVALNAIRDWSIQYGIIAITVRDSLILFGFNAIYIVIMVNNSSIFRVDSDTDKISEDTPIELIIVDNR